MARRKPAQPGRVPFRLTRQARTLDYDWLTSLTEDGAYAWFKAMRFRDNGGAPSCPKCDFTKCYGTGRKGWWSCGRKGCRKQFSVTSGTIFHSRKLSFHKLVKLIFHFADCAKGTSACELHLKFDTTYKAIWVNLMKLREAMSSRRDDTWLCGIVEMDAAYFGGKVRKRNTAKRRAEVDLRKTEYQRGKRTLMVVRQRDGGSVMFAAPAETPDVAVAAVRAVVRLDTTTTLVTDASPAYGDLEAFATHLTVDHDKGFKLEGVSTNMAESSFSRARRAEVGVYHHWSATWLDFYAGEMSWREDRRRVGNMEQARDIAALAVACRPSRDLKGYWQHHLLQDDQLRRTEVRWRRVHDRVMRR